MKRILLTILFLFLITGASFAKVPYLATASELNKMLTELDDINKELYCDLSPIRFESTHQYAIAVNRKSMTVTIYEFNKKTQKYNIPIKSFACSCNKTRTPLGAFVISDQYRWHALYGNCFGQYCSRFYKHILFHSVLYSQNHNPYSLIPSSYNGIQDKVSSGGCIRLQVADAKWLYENCGPNTIVVVYDSDYSGPLGRPDIEKIDENQCYDPTDTFEE